MIAIVHSLVALPELFPSGIVLPVYFTNCIQWRNESEIPVVPGSHALLSQAVWRL